MENSLIYKHVRVKDDGTYIIDFNGIDYHVTMEYPTEGDYTFEKVNAYAKENPKLVESYVEPKQTNLTYAQKILQELETIDQIYRTPRILAEAAIGDEYAIEQLKEGEKLALELRKKLNKSELDSD